MKKDNTNINKFIQWVERELDGKAVVSEKSCGRQSETYGVTVNKKGYFLKISDNAKLEYEKLFWLEDKVLVPRVIRFKTIGKKQALLMTAIDGKNLSRLGKEVSMDKTVDELVKVLQQLHRVSIKDYPFEILDKKGVLIHGDACLTNFIFNKKGQTACIDVGDLTVGNVEVDLAAAVWSLDYNFGAGYGKIFLEKYGIKNVTDELVEKLKGEY